MVFLTMYYMSWGLGYFYENSQLGNLKIRISAIRYMQNAQVMECFSSITSAFSNDLFYRNFLFSHIS